MSWLTITILVPDELLKEAIIGEFSGDAISGVWERPHESGFSEVVFYFALGDLPRLSQPRIRRVFERHDYPAPDIKIDEEEDVDWTIEWRKGFSSFALGKRFRVVPGWEEPPSGDSRIALRIDPGMAFGTGTHESTQMVVESLEHLNLNVPVVDLGTGSGILAIAAIKLGADCIAVCDIDVDAVSVAQSNFRRNQVTAALYIGTIDAIQTASIGIVLANLTCDVIISKLSEITRVLQPAGMAVFSGFLTSQAASIEEHVASAGLKLLERVERGEWASFLVSNGGD